MSDLYDRVLKLRAIRSFDERRITDEDLHRILEAARWTGSSKNRQNWAFVVITDAQDKAALAATGSFTDPIRNAPAVIALVQEPEGYEFDTGRVAQNIMLAADAFGIGTCPITLHDEEAAGEVLGLPTGARCRYAIAMGYRADDAKPARFGGRKPLDEIVHNGHYGS